jgi:ATP-dependent Lon protease
VTGVERELPLFPLEQVVLFPGMPLPLHVFEPRYRVMIGECQVKDDVFGVLLIRSGREVGEPAEPERVGCTARLLRVDRQPDGRMNILTVGEHRFRLQERPRLASEGYLVARAAITDAEITSAVPPSLLAEVAEQFQRYQAAALKLAGRKESEPPADLPTDALRLSFWVAATLHIHARERQHLLEMDDVEARLRQELTLLRRENEPAKKTIGPFSMN